MSEHNDAYAKINDLIKHVRVTMVTFKNQEGQLHSAPMTTQDREFNGEIWFIGTKSSELVQNITRDSEVNLAYNTASHSYVSIHGTAELINDPLILNELWSDVYKAFYSSKEDPNIQVIRVLAHGAQYWEGAGMVATLYKLTKAAMTGEKQSLGKTESVTL